MTQARSAPLSDPAKSQFFRPIAIRSSFYPCRISGEGPLPVAPGARRRTRCSLPRKARRRGGLRLHSRGRCCCGRSGVDVRCSVLFAPDDRATTCVGGGSPGRSKDHRRNKIGEADGAFWHRAVGGIRWQNDAACPSDCPTPLCRWGSRSRRSAFAIRRRERRSSLCWDVFCCRSHERRAKTRFTMTFRELPKEALERSAIVYVRQSTGTQVQENVESQRRQYDLVDLARRYGFRNVAVIDADLGRSASGTMDRPGFRDLVGRICEGAVGAVFCLEASRLARNGRDWHHLLELCGLVGTYVIDGDGVHDPALPNDRLLLGLKGTMSEFELTLIRKRLVDAAVAKARRGELRIGAPLGDGWSRDEWLMIDPHRRFP